MLDSEGNFLPWIMAAWNTFLGVASACSIASAIFSYLAWQKIRKIQKRMIANSLTPGVLVALEKDFKEFQKAGTTADRDKAYDVAGRIVGHVISLADMLNQKQDPEAMQRLRTIRSKVEEFVAAGDTAKIDVQVRECSHELSAVIVQLKNTVAKISLGGPDVR